MLIRRASRPLSPPLAAPAEFFKNFAVSPDELPDEIFKSIGRCAWRDIGLVAIIFSFVRKLVDYNFLLMLIASTAHTMPDFKKHSQ